MEICELCNREAKEGVERGLCLPCELDMEEGIEKEDIDEIENMFIDKTGKCLDCNKVSVLYKDILCWDCYKLACDSYDRDEIKRDYWGEL